MIEHRSYWIPKMNLTKQIIRVLSLFLIILMVTNGVEPCKGPGSPCGSSSDCCGYCRKVGRNPQKKCGSFRGRKWKKRDVCGSWFSRNISISAWQTKNLHDLFNHCNNKKNLSTLLACLYRYMRKFLVYDCLLQFFLNKQ